MLLNNTTDEQVSITIGTSNGREVGANLNACSFQLIDLTRYRPPFNLTASIGDQTTETIMGIEEEQCVSLVIDGGKFILRPSLPSDSK